jgi:hypothetical protein
MEFPRTGHEYGTVIALLKVTGFKLDSPTDVALSRIGLENLKMIEGLSARVVSYATVYAIS